MEVALGVPLAELKAKLLGGKVEENGRSITDSGNGHSQTVQADSSHQQQRMERMDRITRKKWGTDDLFNRFTPGAKGEAGPPPPPREPTPLQKAALKLESAENTEVIQKKVFKVGGDELLVRIRWIRCSHFSASGQIHISLCSGWFSPHNFFICLNEKGNKKLCAKQECSATNYM